MLPSAQIGPLAAAAWMAGGFVAVSGLQIGWTLRKAWIARGDRRTLEGLRRLSPDAFEREVARLVRSLGFSARVTGGSGDGGIDVVARRGKHMLLIQCKRYRSRKVDIGMVRDFYGSVVDREGMALFVTTGAFTRPAREFAAQKRIALLDGPALVQLARGGRKALRGERAAAGALHGL